MQTLLEHLERSRIAFHAEAAGLSADQCAARRSSDVWSIMDVVEHIATYRSAHAVIRYRDGAHLRGILDSEVLAAAEALYAELRPGRLTSARA